MRIYVPVTLDELDGVTMTPEEARWTVGPRAAHAVTQWLREELPDEDDEELEYAAALDAADSSLAMIVTRLGAPRLRAVVTVEVPDGAVEVPEPRPAPAVDDGAANRVGTQPEAETDEEDDPAPSLVEVTRTVRAVPIVCVHVDEVEAAEDVESVIAAANLEGPEGDELLDRAIERITDRDMLWYDWSEIPQIPRG